MSRKHFPGSSEESEFQLSPSIVLVIAAMILIAPALLMIIFNGGRAEDPLENESVSEPNHTPRLVIARDVIDLGDQAINSTVEASFTLSNAGEVALQIYQAPQVDVVTGCCAPQATVSSMEVAPGEEALIRLAFTMQPQMAGQQEYRVTLRSNDPVESIKRLTVRVNGIP